MATPTYTLIEEQVLGSSAASVTFSSIPGTYKDLVLECVPLLTTGGYDIWYDINSDSGGSYADTILYGNGTSAGSARNTNATKIYLGYYGTGATGPTTQSVHFMSYTNTQIYKTMIGRANRADSGTDAIVGLYRSTSAITTIRVFPTTTTWASGSTFRLWGIA